MPLLNYTTSKKAADSLAEIQRILANYGVSAVMTEFEGRNVSAVSFKMDLEGRSMSFRLPCNWRAVHTVLQAYNENRPRKRTARGMEMVSRIKDDEEHAIAVAWRIIKDWVEAQMALVEVNMATVPQVFLPYAMMKDGRTLAEKVYDEPGFLLGDGV